MTSSRRVLTALPDDDVAGVLIVNATGGLEWHLTEDDIRTSAEFSPGERRWLLEQLAAADQLPGSPSCPAYPPDWL